MDANREYPQLDVNSANLLAILQLADSFFPAGMFAHSHGLEGMVNRGLVRSAEDVAEFLENQFSWSVMPSDGGRRTPPW